MEPMDYSLARKTVKRYCCSMCWGDLEIHPDPIEQDKHYVVCQKCQEQTKGYVTKYFADRRRNDNEFEKRDAVRLLQDMGILDNPLKGKGQEDLLREIGF